MSKQTGSNSKKDQNTAPSWVKIGSGLVAAALAGGLIGYMARESNEESVLQEQQTSCHRGTDFVPLNPPEECIICYDQISPPMEILPCGHMFHRKCILQWFQVSSNAHCPECRNKLSSAQLEVYIKRSSEI